MQEPWNTIVAAVFGAAAACIINWLFGWKERGLRAEERKERRMDRECWLREIEESKKVDRRGRSPLLTVAQTPFNMVGDWHVNNGNVLSKFRDVVQSEKMTSENLVVLPVQDAGPSILKCLLRFEGSDKKLSFYREDPSRTSHGLLILEYPFDPTLFGKRQRLVFEFESEGGYQDSHIYETIHGHRHLERIEPS